LPWYDPFLLNLNQLLPSVLWYVTCQKFADVQIKRRVVGQEQYSSWGIIYHMLRTRNILLTLLTACSSWITNFEGAAWKGGERVKVKPSGEILFHSFLLFNWHTEVQKKVQQNTLYQHYKDFMGGSLEIFIMRTLSYLKKRFNLISNFHYSSF